MDTDVSVATGVFRQGDRGVVVDKKARLMNR